MARTSFKLLFLVFILAIWAHAEEPLPEGKHFTILRHPDAKALYDVSYKDCTLEECMQGMREQAAIGTIAMKPSDSLTKSYDNLTPLTEGGRLLAHTFGIGCDRYGAMAALVDDRLKPLFAGKTDEVDPQVPELFLHVKMQSVAVQLAGSLTPNQLAMNQQDGIPISALSKAQYDQVEFLCRYRQIMDPYDTSPKDDLKKAVIHLYDKPQVGFKGVPEKYYLVGWASDETKGQQVEAEMEKNGGCPPRPNLNPDARLEKDVTIAAADISLAGLLNKVSEQTGAPLRVEAKYANLRLSAFMKTRGADVLAAVADVTGLGWDKSGGGWALSANDWARTTTDWRLRYLYSKPDYRLESKAKETLKSLPVNTLPIYADKEWTTGDRICSLLQNRAELGVSALTPDEQAWVKGKLRIWEQCLELPENELALQAEGWRYTFKPYLELVVTTPRCHLYSASVLIPE